MLPDTDAVVRAMVKRLSSEPRRRDDVAEGNRWRHVLDDVIERFGGEGGVQAAGPGPGALEITLAEPNNVLERRLRSRYGDKITISYGGFSPT